MAGRNERKAVVLGLLLRHGSVLTRDLVQRWGLSYSGAQAALEKYRHQGLLRREREPGPGPPVYRYFLGKAGRRKAMWMAGQALLQAREQEHLPGLEPEEPRIKPVIRSEERLHPRLLE